MGFSPGVGIPGLQYGPLGAGHLKAFSIPAENIPGGFVMREGRNLYFGHFEGFSLETEEYTWPGGNALNLW